MGVPVVLVSILRSSKGVTYAGVSLKAEAELTMTIFFLFDEVEPPLFLSILYIYTGFVPPLAHVYLFFVSICYGLGTEAAREVR